ncbi:MULTISPECIES: glutamate--tRNA ligase [Halomonadaceae]|jgi:glutamyl-tRNA synthetase|uniref:Glutamate--tRNA ligase n=1 Tax=Vreelandella titanicae BH1 TaxID=1204738 RepID=L9U9P4_9GAMM|nr:MULTISPECIES: glutamate--tRNA ligase [Halomonas]NAO96616.1 glutamate--tRNA ligase [Halomonas sp. MG34]UEQ05486.1 glutamate--tRNA ligase [Halomonas profundus]ELY21640.1 Glutamyl/glutaminyl-tRNA synthetase, class Ic [Halomonas titanicae BH1]KIN16210.1 glutamyl-tRNA synthetase [Halomonas sp. KHS3]MCD1586167.1 glutamate--tRNA ligase [Halomonas sp. IOP_14]|tara:strand:- start:97 stop:1581 length:1485 start_codon:yes stop_codon:yes gene_type:complete
MTVRTRIAPSPTGDPHVGTAYIALFNLCFARQHGGQFILRIEDTDRVRSTPESEQMILDSLRWLGLEWDEGPDVGGPHGPYRQSERGDIYAQYAQQLLDAGHAFKCYRTSEELDELRETRKAAGLHLALKPADLALESQEQARREQEGWPYVVRMNVPAEGVCVVNDMLRGTIEVEWAQVDAQILLKSDGMPTYHLANVVDDHLMAITHVLRGEEWINSAPKHQLLYEYFGWQMPQLCHMPLLRNPDKSKLSKRKNPTSINYYRRMGFLPQAVTNYLGRMGWSMPDEREKFSLQEMMAEFDVQRVSLGGPVFDLEKLTWLNGVYIREDLDDDALLSALRDWAFNEAYVKQILPQVRPRVETLSQVMPLAGHFFSGLPALTKASFDSVKLEEEELVKLLQFLVWRFEGVSAWHKEALLNEVKTLAEHFDLKMKAFLAPVFIAITGSASSTSVMDAMAILGSDVTRARLRSAIEVLGGVSKKQAKRFEKEFREIAS